MTVNFFIWNLNNFRFNLVMDQPKPYYYVINYFILHTCTIKFVIQENLSKRKNVFLPPSHFNFNRSLFAMGQKIQIAILKYQMNKSQLIRAS